MSQTSRPVAPRPGRRRRSETASWAFPWSVDLLLSLLVVLLLVAAVVGAVGLTYAVV